MFEWLDVLGDMPNNLKVLTKPEDGKVVYENTFGDSKYVSLTQFICTCVVMLMLGSLNIMDIFANVLCCIYL